MTGNTGAYSESETANVVGVYLSGAWIAHRPLLNASYPTFPRHGANIVSRRTVDVENMVNIPLVARAIPCFTYPPILGGLRVKGFWVDASRRISLSTVLRAAPMSQTFLSVLPLSSIRSCQKVLKEE